jgi:hypothetical protein
VGEIGIDRNTFLYEVSFWEVRRIIRGYRRRNRTTHQLLAECVYATTFSNRSPEGRTVKDLFPSLFDDEEPVAPLSQAEREELLQDIRNFNAQKQDAG